MRASKSRPLAMLLQISFPHLGRSFVTTGGDVSTIGAAGDAADIARVADQGLAFNRGFQVPDFDRLVFTAGNDAFTVGRECGVEDWSRMSIELEGLLSRFDVPDADRSVFAR